MQTPTLFVSLVMAGTLSAQWGGLGSAVTPLAPPPMPPQALPVVPPPVDHPAYAAQPLIESGSGAPAAAPARPANAGPKAPPETKEAREAREFRERKLAGKALKKAIDGARKELDFKKSMVDARAMSAAENKPILWVQALGDLNGLT